MNPIIVAAGYQSIEKAGSLPAGEDHAISFCTETNEETRWVNNIVPLNRPGATVGFFDRFEEGNAFGWIVNTAFPLDPVTVHVVIDGQEVDCILADLPRDDVRVELNHPTGAVGFKYVVPSDYLDGKDHRISFRLRGGEAVEFCDYLDPSRSAPSLAFKIKLQPKIAGYVDGLRQGQIHGWALRTDRGAASPVGACHVLVTCNGRRVAQLRADRYRGDVAAVTGGDPNCGFQLMLPREFQGSTPQTFRFEVMPEGVELERSPLTTSTVDDRLAGALLDMSKDMDAMLRRLTAMRRHVEDMVPQPGYNLSDYDRWARAYYPALRARVAAERERRATKGDAGLNPLVSVLVPAYRPLISDFVAAIESVLAQTYQNWELIIVDDCSKQPALTAQIAAFCKRDGRIRSIVRERNGNISEATNTAIQAAKGEYVAFFDHDDLLVDVALEVMALAAQSTGARLLFSDEDKIDQAGYFLEPNFKPDWNYRYILGCNYVCHLLFVERSALAEAGLLRSKYNGAQDHDLILRLSETVAAGQIHHVPEMLYHWRKTPNSTASDISRKGYAVNAGVLAVGDHLARRGAKAKVRNVRGLTLYNPVWQDTATPKVCIVIPYKDQIETTRDCLETLLNRTKYRNFEIILVDNWSMTAAAADFSRFASKKKRVRVLRVEEEFNFSRLNNLASAQTDAELLVFMNNDLFPEKADWLRLLVGETLVDSGVAAVGGRYLYPNGTIQHAGVAVGPRGLAAHVHRGAPATDYGYAGRIALAHDVTAVTAACMLVRASAFHEVGGFDEAGLKVAFNDVDLCLKLRAAGHRIVYCAEMTAVHHESLSRGSDDRPEHEARFRNEQRVLLERWGEHPLFKRDPAYSSCFTIDRQPFYDLEPPQPLAACASSNDQQAHTPT